jgi:hypothetical protein
LPNFKGTGKNEEEVVGLVNHSRCHLTSSNLKIMSIELNGILADGWADP